MKLLLALVSILVLYTVDCRHPPDEAGNHDSVSGLQQVLDEADGIDATQTGQQLSEGILLVDDGLQDGTPDDADQQSEKVKGQKARNLRRSRCKARNSCVVMGGFCVTNGTLCGGRLVPEGCRGINCQCCVPGTLETKIQELENELLSMKHNLTNDNLEITKELNSMKENINNTNSGFNSKLDSIKDNQGSGFPKGFFRADGSTQFYKFFNDTPLSWTSAKAKCQSEGMFLAKPSNSIPLRKFMVENFGSKYAWIGAQGTGSYFRWDRTSQSISNSDSLWWPNHPGSRTSSINCLRFESSTSDLSSQPTKPYYVVSCTGKYYPLCELVMN